MLFESNEAVDIIEIPIKTVYESKADHQTHFNPFKDSIIIYQTIFKYSASSVLSTVIDFIIFAISVDLGYSVWLATAAGRITAAFINFALNRNAVFKVKHKLFKQFIEYVILVTVSGIISACTITFFQRIIPIDAVVMKIMVEAILFFFNYYVQRTLIFAKDKKLLIQQDYYVATDWTKYYTKGKSWFSTHTERYTSDIIVRTIKKYIKSDNIDLIELGGGNSCFAKEICKTCKIRTYDIIDNNAFAVSLFEHMKIDAKNHSGIRMDLLDPNEQVMSKYDFVYSVGLIEHFRGQDIYTVIKKHYDYCRAGGCILVAFPTPTAKYRFFRHCMELFGVWQFYDEEPIEWEKVKEYFSRRGEVIEQFINKRLPLEQMVVVCRQV